MGSRVRILKPLLLLVCYILFHGFNEIGNVFEPKTMRSTSVVEQLGLITPCSEEEHTPRRIYLRFGLGLADLGEGLRKQSFFFAFDAARKQRLGILITCLGRADC